MFSTSVAHGQEEFDDRFFKEVGVTFAQPLKELVADVGNDQVNTGFDLLNGVNGSRNDLWRSVNHILLLCLRPVLCKSLICFGETIDAFRMLGEPLLSCPSDSVVGPHWTLNPSRLGEVA